MKFLVDANLPRKLAHALTSLGHEAIHTLDLPDGNATPDEAILAHAKEHDCIVLTKDSDFSTSYWVRHEPSRLLLISTGNIKNAELIELISTHEGQIALAMGESAFVELTRSHIIRHS